MSTLLAILLSALAASGVGIELRWNLVPGATGYRISWGLHSGPGWHGWWEDVGPTNRLRIYGFLPGKTYYFIGQASNHVAFGLPSNEAIVTVPAGAPDAMVLQASIIAATNFLGPWSNIYTYPEQVVWATNREHLFRIKLEIAK